MADIVFAAAVDDEGKIFPILKLADDAARNGLILLGQTGATPEDAVPASDDVAEWFRDSLSFLDTHAPDAGQHVNAPMIEQTPSPIGTEARGHPWYAVFEDADGAIWAARFMDANLPGLLTGPDGEGLEGVLLLTDHPARVDFSALDVAAARPRRSALALARGSVSGGATAARDHGTADGGGVIKDLWGDDNGN